MFRQRPARQFPLILLLLVGLARGDNTLVVDFEIGLPDGLDAINARAALSADSPVGGQKCLRFQVDDPQKRSVLRLPLPADCTPASAGAIQAAIRPGPTTQPVQLRWLALDRDGQPLFQRRVRIEGNGKWATIDAPFVGWRWGDDRTGDWSEVRGFALRVESPVQQIDIDDIRLSPKAADDPTQWLLRLAFDGRPRVAQADDLLVATDAVDEFTDPDLQRLLKAMQRARAFIRANFPKAARRTHHARPAALLIFRDAEAQKRFFTRLGEQWQAQIASPTAGGYTVQDIATSTWKADMGADRPVYLHEALHGIVGRELRLMSGHPLHDPLQEGLANYVQLCLYPVSLQRKTFEVHFNRPIDPSGDGFFQPLPKLLAGRVKGSQYAQLASLVAYLVEKDPATLDAWAGAAATGKTFSHVLESQGRTFAQLEADWLAWGKARFSQPPKPGETHFAVPGVLTH